MDKQISESHKESILFLVLKPVKQLYVKRMINFITYCKGVT